MKFQCAGCVAEGHDRHRDNAIVWPSGKWGCAVGGRAHNAAIARQLDPDMRVTAVPPTTIVVPHPVLAPEALYGLAGRIVRTVEPFSEADNAATLVHLLVAVGNLVSRTSTRLGSTRSWSARRRRGARGSRGRRRGR